LQTSAKITFQCWQCGACCKLTPLLERYNIPVNSEGHCVHLKDNRCSIYAVRPAVCRVSSSRRTVFAHLSDSEFARMYTKICRAVEEEIKKKEKKDRRDTNERSVDTQK